MSSVDVDPVVYAQASATVDSAAASLGNALDSFLAGISGSNGMAGTDQTAETFAGSYDTAAYDAANAFGRLIDMTGNAADVIKVSGTNHAEADAASTGQGVEPAPPLPPRSQALTLCPYITAKGSDDGGPGGILGRVWDAIESMVGYVWPNGSPEQVRAAGSIWSSAAGSIGCNKMSIQLASGQLGTQKSPEIAPATDYLNGLKSKFDELQTSCSDLAQSCNDLAAAIEEAHQELIDELEQFAVEFAIGELAFAVLFEIGGEIWGNAAMAARAAVVARRCADIIRRLIDSARTVAQIAKKAGDAVKAILTKLKDLKTGAPKPAPLPPLRQAYIKEVEGLADLEKTMRAAGSSEEEIARALHNARREIGVNYKEMTPEPLRSEIFQRNIDKYGDPLGPTFDTLLKRGKSLEDIIESAKRTGGRDLGLDKK